MKIPVKEIKEFIKRSAAIQTGNIMPVLGYYLLADGTLTKTNLGVFCKHTITYTDEPLTILLEELALKSICNNTSEEEIELTVDGTNVTIRAGKQTQSFETLPVVDFPKFPGGQGTQSTLSQSAISSIVAASKYVGTNSHNYNYIHSVGGDVFASNGFIMYNKKHEGFPALILSEEAAGIIGQYNEITHYYNGVNIDFFQSAGTIYGFVRPEVNTPQYSNFLALCKHSGGIKFDKEQVERFCQTTIDITQGDKDLVCLIEDNGANECLLSYNNKGTKRKNELTVEVEGKTDMISDFRFKPQEMIKALRALPCCYVWFVFEPDKILVYDDEDKDYQGIIMGLK